MEESCSYLTLMHSLGRETMSQMARDQLYTGAAARERSANFMLNRAILKVLQLCYLSLWLFIY